jgi:hypothetical protein
VTNGEPRKLCAGLCSGHARIHAQVMPEFDRRFPPPWTIEEYNQARLIMKDATESRLGLCLFRGGAGTPLSQSAVGSEAISPLNWKRHQRRLSEAARVRLLGRGRIGRPGRADSAHEEC